jgi:hypothetical protein
MALVCEKEASPGGEAGIGGPLFVSLRPKAKALGYEPGPIS